MSLVGAYVALSKPLTMVFPVFLLALLRFGLAAVAMLPWTAPQKGETPLSPREHGLLFIMSLFGNFLFSICMLSGIRLTTATAAGVILATLPAVIAVMSWLLLREALSRRVVVAVVLAMLGIALLHLARDVATSAENASASDATPLGTALLFGAVLCEATYVIVGKRLAAVRSPLRVSALINLWGLVLILPFGAAQTGPFDWRGVSAFDWALLVFYSLAASLAAVWLWMTGLRHVPANQAGVFTVALPASATLVGVFYLNEQFTSLHAVALLLAMAAVALLATAAPRA